MFAAAMPLATDCAYKPGTAAKVNANTPTATREATEQRFDTYLLISCLDVNPTVLPPTSTTHAADRLKKAAGRLQSVLRRDHSTFLNSVAPIGRTYGGRLLSYSSSAYSPVTGTDDRRDSNHPPTTASYPD